MFSLLQFQGSEAWLCINNDLNCADAADSLLTSADIAGTVWMSAWNHMQFCIIFVWKLLKKFQQKLHLLVNSE